VGLNERGLTGNAQSLMHYIYVSVLLPENMWEKTHLYRPICAKSC
jgi:hypothetical protein